MSAQAIIAFLGGGAMASALISGLVKAGAAPTAIRAAEPDPDRRAGLEERFGVSVFTGNAAAAAGADVVVVAVKPGVVSAVLKEIAGGLAPETVVLSIAAGVTLAHLARELPPGQPVVRVMPNTPALIGAGISVLCPSAGTPEEKLNLARTVMAAAGEVAIAPDESWMDGVTALSGSGPAYVFLMAEALSDGGVACGLPRDLADRLAIQTLAGSARLLAETGAHPGVLKNQVTSPGGTTIAGLRQLEKAGVRHALMEAVAAAWRRSRELSGG